MVVVDPRSPFATVERLPDAHEVLREWPDAALARAGLDAGSAVVVLSHDPKFDIPALALALRSPAYYVGALGSRRTHARRLAQLREVGLSDAELARIRAPIGLDLGGREPEEIALAIVAEIQAVRYERDGESLREGSGSIHAGSARSGFTSAIVLAAGRSTRMGRNKALAPLGGRPVLQHVLDAAAASSADEIVLVLGRGRGGDPPRARAAIAEFRPAWSSSRARRPPRACRCGRGCVPSIRARRGRRSCSATSRA